MSYHCVKCSSIAWILNSNVYIQVCFVNVQAAGIGIAALHQSSDRFDILALFIVADLQRYALNANGDTVELALHARSEHGELCKAITLLGTNSVQLVQLKMKYT